MVDQHQTIGCFEDEVCVADQNARPRGGLHGPEQWHLGEEHFAPGYAASCHDLQPIRYLDTGLRPNAPLNPYASRTAAAWPSRSAAGRTRSAPRNRCIAFPTQPTRPARTSNGAPISCNPAVPAPPRRRPGIAPSSTRATASVWRRGLPPSSPRSNHTSGSRSTTGNASSTVSRRTSAATGATPASANTSHVSPSSTPAGRLKIGTSLPASRSSSQPQAISRSSSPAQPERADPGPWSSPRRATDDSPREPPVGRVRMPDGRRPPHPIRGLPEPLYGHGQNLIQRPASGLVASNPSSGGSITGSNIRASAPLLRLVITTTGHSSPFARW